jgi:hypothetical protein
LHAERVRVASLRDGDGGLRLLFILVVEVFPVRLVVDAPTFSPRRARRGEEAREAPLRIVLPEEEPPRCHDLLVELDEERVGAELVVARDLHRARFVRGRTLLVLDTVTGSDAERLYARLGWERCGVIPSYALFPKGGLCSTTVLYRQLADVRG